MNDIGTRPAAADRPIPDLLRDLTTEIKTLVADELALVRIEVAKTGKKAGESAGLFGAATLFGIGAFFAFTLMLVGLLSLAMHVWLAALIVTVGYGAIAGVAALNGKKKLETVGSPIPPSTTESLRRDVEAVKLGVERGR